MSRNDVVMTPLRVKQAIDSRFVKVGDELHVLIGGTWVEFVKKVELPPPVNCAELLTMYKGDTTLTETPVINATGCTSLAEVFMGCSNLVTVNYIHMPNVTNMYHTFRNCTSLTSIPELDTSNVTAMAFTFYGCSSLTSIPPLDTSNVTNMNYTFRNCTSLTSIPPLDVSNVTNMGAMFDGCSSVTSIPELDTSSVTDVSYMFRNCSSLTSIPELDTSGVTRMDDMFNGCSSLTSIPELDTSGVTRMDDMFNGCSSLTSIPEMDTSNVTNMGSMFQNCSSLTTVPTLDTSNVTSMSQMFQNCSSLTSTPEMDTSSVTSMMLMFYGCTSLTSVTFVGDVVPPYNTFLGGTPFDGTPIASGNGYIFVPDEMVNAYRTASGWSTHASVIRGISEKIAPLLPVVNCTDLLTMYKGDLTLTETPLINATGCTTLREAFRGCTNLKTVKYIHTPNVTTLYYAFGDCTSLTSIPALDTSNVTSMNSTFESCSSLTSIPELDTSNVTNMAFTFYGCSSLTSIPPLDTSNVTNMNYTFRNCTSLTSIPPLDVSNVTITTGMFNGCSSLTSVTFTGNVVPPYGTGVFNGTPIVSGNGHILVPDELVDEYKVADGWSNHASIIKGINEQSGWYDTLGLTEFVDGDYGIGTQTNEVQYTHEEMLDILPFHVKWEGTFTNVETGEPADKNAININIVIDNKDIKFNQEYEDDGRIVQSDDLPDLSEEGFYTFKLKVGIATNAPSENLLDGYFEIRENDANGVVLGHYPILRTIDKGCYLTSTMVGYYGVADDGVELTAMRRLREVYAEKHAETLRTYYEDSRIIVPEIERLGMQDYYYGHIKDVVDEIVIHVDNENWSVAEELYLDLYYGLKEELM